MSHTDEQVAAVYNDIGRYPDIASVAAALGYKPGPLRNRVAKIRVTGSPPLVDRRAAYESKPSMAKAMPVRRWLLTAAQDDTAVHAGFWANLVAYAQVIGAEILVGGFTYQKGLFEDHASRTAVFPETVRPYLRHENVTCGPLLFAAKMNILPTAVRPLSGLENYSRGAWAVFPHAKVQLVSVPALPGSHPAMVMTTGACTLPNYIEKKAGLKAEFHHQIGATIVEVDECDRVFCRQISAIGDGSFQDLDVIVRNGEVSRGHRVEAITWGDIHREKIDPVIARTCWGFDVATEQIVTRDSMISALKPRHQFFHDILDFRSRNHHRRGDHIHGKLMSVLGAESVDDELSLCARFLRATQFDYCASVVVASNHNDALLRWLRETDPRLDPLNLKTWCELNLEWHRRIEAVDTEFDLFQHALSRHDSRLLDDIIFVPRGGSYQICQDRGGIECGAHGDEGPNGSRGSALSLNRVSVRMTIGHAHSAAILDGVHVVGLCGLMDQGYNSGPSGWSHTQGVTYPNSRRTLITLIDGKWRA
jgi:hypothetical protein